MSMMQRLALWASRYAGTEITREAERFFGTIRPYVDHPRVTVFGIGERSNSIAQGYAYALDEPPGRGLHGVLVIEDGRVKGIEDYLVRGRRTVVIGEGNGTTAELVKKRLLRIQERLSSSEKVDGAFYFGIPSRTEQTGALEEQLFYTELLSPITPIQSSNEPQQTSKR